MIQGGGLYLQSSILHAFTSIISCNEINSGIIQPTLQSSHDIYCISGNVTFDISSNIIGIGTQCLNSTMTFQNDPLHSTTTINICNINTTCPTVLSELIPPPPPVVNTSLPFEDQPGNLYF